MGTIRLELGEELISILNNGKTVTFQLAGPRTTEIREDALPARIIKWAARRKDFEIDDVEREFKLSRAHTSMLLSRLASGRYPIVRLARGRYAHKDAPKRAAAAS